MRCSAYLRNGCEIPVILVFAVQGGHQTRRQDQRVGGPIRASLDDDNANVGIFGKTVSQDEAGRATADDDKLEWLVKQLGGRHLALFAGQMRANGALSPWSRSSDSRAGLGERELGSDEYWDRNDEVLKKSRTECKSRDSRYGNSRLQ